MAPINLKSVRSKGLKIAQFIVIANILQSVIGVVLVARQRQSPTSAWFGGNNSNNGSGGNNASMNDLDRLKSEVEEEARRLSAIERTDLRDLNSRLAVMETREADNERRTGDIEHGIDDIRKLAYGALVTIIVSVVAQFIQIRESRKNRT